MTDFFLGVIAAAVAVMAAIQVAAVVAAARAARRIEMLVQRMEQDLGPAIANLQAMTAEAARATSLATAQVERADRLFADLAVRLEGTLATVQDAILVPVRESAGWLAGLKAFLAALVDRRNGGRARAGAVDEDDALFIG